VLKNVCVDNACFGVQANYRISSAVLAFFLFMAVLTAVAPFTHHGAWLLKLVAYVALLGISLAIPNTFYDTYSEIARYVSILFLLLQVRDIGGRERGGGQERVRGLLPGFNGTALSPPTLPHCRSSSSSTLRTRCTSGGWRVRTAGTLTWNGTDGSRACAATAGRLPTWPCVPAC